MSFFLFQTCKCTQPSLILLCFVWKSSLSYAKMIKTTIDLQGWSLGDRWGFTQVSVGWLTFCLVEKVWRITTAVTFVVLIFHKMLKFKIWFSLCDMPWMTIHRTTDLGCFCRLCGLTTVTPTPGQSLLWFPHENRTVKILCKFWSRWGEICQDFPTMLSITVCCGVSSHFQGEGAGGVKQATHWRRKVEAVPAISLMPFCNLHKTIFKFQISNEAKEWCMLMQYKWPPFYYNTVNLS